MYCNNDAKVALLLRHYSIFTKKITDIKKYLAELVGTFTLTFLGCAAAVSLNCSIDPALFEGGKALSDIWVFIVDPLAGGALAALVWKVISPAEKA